MGHLIDILFIYDNSFHLGGAYLDDDQKFNIHDERGRPIDLNDISKIWIIENDDICLISQDDLHNLLSPLFDQNGHEVHMDDYIAKTEGNDKLVVYQVRSIDETMVSVKVIHDSHCPMLMIMRDNIASSWAVIPYKKN